MIERELELRVENIEETLRSLNTLPARMGGLEARVGGLEARVGGLDGRLGSLETQFLQFRQEVRGEFSAVRQEMREFKDEVKTHAKVLHEDLIERLKALKG